jgi:hypothetical protein
MADMRLAHPRELGLISVRLASFRVCSDQAETDLASDFLNPLRKPAPLKETGRGE